MFTWYFSIFQMILIFAFVVNCVMMFLIATLCNNIEELKRCILPERAQTDAAQQEGNNVERTVEEQLQMLIGELDSAKHVIKDEIKSGEEMMSNTKSNTLVHQDMYKSLMIKLKRDIHKVEEEVKELRNEVLNLRIRRMGLRNEVVKVVRIRV